MHHMQGHTMMSTEAEACSRLCLQCSRTCVEAVTHCLKKGGKYADAKHIQALLDCAEICQTTANVLARGSELHGRLCAVCADACEQCTESCEQVDPNDEMMKQCAEMCRRCAQSCRALAV